MQGKKLDCYPLVFGAKGAIIAARDHLAVPSARTGASMTPQLRRDDLRLQHKLHFREHVWPS